MNADAAKSVLEQMLSDGGVVALGSGNISRATRFYTAGGWKALTERTRAALGDYHRQFPLRAGAPKEELRSRLNLSQQVFSDALRILNERGITVEDGSTTRLPDHVPSIGDALQGLVDDYLRQLESDPFSPPTDIVIDSELVNLLDERGQVVKVSESVVFSASAYDEMVDRISGYLNNNGEITVADVRDLLGTSRKYALALMDHLDHVRITRRVGDVRVLR